MKTVLSGLERGEIGLGDLTARRLGGLVGKTTSVLYHHFGSLDGFLYRVSQAGFSKLAEHLVSCGPKLEDIAVGFVEFGLDRPCLYGLMFERRFDWARLRDQGYFEDTAPGLDMWSSLIATIEAHGSKTPDVDARLLYSGLHGLVSQALSGRANVGALDVPDRDMATELARQLVRRIAPETRIER